MRPAWLAATESALLISTQGRSRFTAQQRCELLRADTWWAGLMRIERLAWLVRGHEDVGQVPTILDCYRLYLLGVNP